jgi:hypothetical protein
VDGAFAPLLISSSHSIDEQWWIKELTFQHSRHCLTSINSMTSSSRQTSAHSNPGFVLKPAYVERRRQSLQKPFSPINRLVQLLDCMGVLRASERQRLVGQTSVLANAINQIQESFLAFLKVFRTASLITLPFRIDHPFACPGGSTPVMSFSTQRIFWNLGAADEPTQDNCAATYC